MRAYVDIYKDEKFVAEECEDFCARCNNVDFLDAVNVICKECFEWEQERMANEESCCSNGCYTCLQLSPRDFM